MLLESALFDDPFSDGFIWFYGAREYLLISAGPNRRFDSVPWAHNAKGYKNLATGELVKPEGIAFGSMTASEIAGRPASREGVKLDINTIYDPTNGLLSGGDIVFRPFEGDNFLYSYRAKRYLRSPEMIVPKDLRAQFSQYLIE